MPMPRLVQAARKSNRSSQRTQVSESAIAVISAAITGGPENPNSAIASASAPPSCASRCRSASSNGAVRATAPSQLGAGGLPLVGVAIREPTQKRDSLGRDHFEFDFPCPPSADQPIDERLELGVGQPNIGNRYINRLRPRKLLGRCRVFHREKNDGHVQDTPPTLRRPRKKPAVSAVATFAAP